MLKILLILSFCFIPLYAYIAKIERNGTERKFRMPIPPFNVIKGGSHAGNGLAVQAFMILPVGAIHSKKQ